jgi:DNA polymerase III subunit delta
VADLNPVYLVHGDDDAKIDAWRKRVRARAEQEHGAGGLESFDASESGPEAVAAELQALTFATGTRYLLVEDAGIWKAAQLEPLEAALAAMPPDTALVLIVRGKPLKQLLKAVQGAGGEVRACAAPKPWELPKWTMEQARELGLQPDAEAAKALVALAGPGQQRIARELEKLSVAIHPEVRLTLEHVERLAAGATGPQAYDLADALVSHDLSATLALAEDLAARNEAPGGLVWRIVDRLRSVHRAAELLEAGVPEREIAGALRQPPWLAKKTLAKAKTADRATLERALCVFAELEVELRGGGDLDEDTAFSLALAKAAG